MNCSEEIYEECRSRQQLCRLTLKSLIARKICSEELRGENGELEAYEILSNVNFQKLSESVEQCRRSLFEMQKGSWPNLIKYPKAVDTAMDQRYFFETDLSMPSVPLPSSEVENSKTQNCAESVVSTRFTAKQDNLDSKNLKLFVDLMSLMNYGYTKVVCYTCGRASCSRSASRRNPCPERLCESCGERHRYGKECRRRRLFQDCKRSFLERFMSRRMPTAHSAVQRKRGRSKEKPLTDSEIVRKKRDSRDLWNINDQGCRTPWTLMIEGKIRSWDIRDDQS